MSHTKQVAESILIEIESLRAIKDDPDKIKETLTLLALLTHDAAALAEEVLCDAA